MMWDNMNYTSSLKTVLHTVISEAQIVFAGVLLNKIGVGKFFLYMKNKQTSKQTKISAFGKNYPLGQKISEYQSDRCV